MPVSKVPTAARPWVGRLVRLGYLAKGLIYTLIGVLALRLALGMSGGRLTDPSGVLMTLLQQPFGRMLLLTIGIGIVAYAAYYLFEAIADLRRLGGGFRGWFNRSLTIIKAVAYGTIGIEALNIVLFNRGSSGDAEDNARLVMRFPLGDVLLVLVGLGIAIYGFSQLKMAWDGTADDDLDAARVRREASWIFPLGRIGTTARSVLLIGMGITLLWSGFQERPSNADGYSEVLATIASVNPWLLTAMGIGVMCFGLFQLCHVRYAKLVVE
jgi:Domain of Unknown Function (DUF1206)